MAEPFCYVYMLASRKGGTLYVGITSELVGRVYQHKLGVIEGFTKRYGVDRLVYFEPHAEIERSISREKKIKKWARGWKIQLIEKDNPDWADLYHQIAAEGLDSRFRGNDIKQVDKQEERQWP